MTSTAKLANSPKTFLDRDNWMRAVLVSDLPDAAARVAIALALHLRHSCSIHSRCRHVPRMNGESWQR